MIFNLVIVNIFGYVTIIVILNWPYGSKIKGLRISIYTLTYIYSVFHT